MCVHDGRSPHPPPILFPYMPCSPTGIYAHHMGVSCLLRRACRYLEMSTGERSRGKLPYSRNVHATRLIVFVCVLDTMAVCLIAECV